MGFFSRIIQTISITFFMFLWFFGTLLFDDVTVLFAETRGGPLPDYYHNDDVADGD